MVKWLLISIITPEIIIQYDRRYPAQHHRFTSRVNTITKTNTHGMGHNILWISLCGYSLCTTSHENHISASYIHTTTTYFVISWKYSIERGRDVTPIVERLIINGKITLYLRSLYSDDVIHWDKQSCLTMFRGVPCPLTFHLCVPHVLKAFT